MEYEFSVLAITTHDLTSEVINDHFTTSFKALTTTTLFVRRIIPQDVKEVHNGPHAKEWKKAMNVEMATLIKTVTWELFELWGSTTSWCQNGCLR